MEKFKIGDIFIGNYSQTQSFGGNASMYAQFGLKGHNGLDFGTPNGIQIVSTADGWISEIGTDPTGYGNYLKVVHNGYLTIYAHFREVIIKLNEKVVSGQLLGYSDNTGNSTGPHLHFAVAPCDAKGIKTEINNGYSGYIDPNGDRCQWVIKNLTKPVEASSSSNELAECLAQHTKLVNEAVVKDKKIEELNKQLTTCSANGDLCQTKLNSMTLEKQEIEKQSAIYKASYDELPKTKELLEQAEKDKIDYRSEITNLNSALTKKTNQYNALKKPGLKFMQDAMIKLLEHLNIPLT